MHSASTHTCIHHALEHTLSIHSPLTHAFTIHSHIHSASTHTCIHHPLTHALGIYSYIYSASTHTCTQLPLTHVEWRDSAYHGRNNGINRTATTTTMAAAMCLASSGREGDVLGIRW